MELEVTVARLDERSKRNEGRIKELETNYKILQELATSVRLLASTQERTEKKVDKLQQKIDALESADGKKWRSLIEKIVGLLVAATVGFLLAQIGL